MNKENILNRLQTWDMCDNLIKNSINNACFNEMDDIGGLAFPLFKGGDTFMRWFKDYLIPEIIDEIFHSPEVTKITHIPQDTPAIKKKTKGGLIEFNIRVWRSYLHRR